MSESVRFRKKPVEVEAMRTGPDTAHDVLLWIRNGGTHANMLTKGGMVIGPLGGYMYADPGDWIIRGVKGEFYPVKPDIFEATYEPVAVMERAEAAEALAAERGERLALIGEILPRTSCLYYSLGRTCAEQGRPEFRESPYGGQEPNHCPPCRVRAALGPEADDLLRQREAGRTQAVGYATVEQGTGLSQVVGYSGDHDSTDHHCLNEPCIWHPYEQRIQPRPSYPATLTSPRATQDRPACATYPDEFCICRSTLRAHPSVGTCTRRREHVRNLRVAAPTEGDE